MSSTVLKVNNLSRKFGRNTVINDVSFELGPGEIAALLGRNGAGKTTLVKILSGLLPPTVGSASILGTSCQRLRAPHFQDIAFVAEGQALPVGLTLNQFLAGLRPFYPSWDRDLEKALLEELNLDPAIPLTKLSRGESMKAQLAAALPFRPKLLLLDEPLAGLDPTSRSEVLTGILEMAAKETPPTVLLVTHDLDEIEHIASRILVLHDGKLALDSPADSLPQATLRETFTAITTPSVTTP